jgi:undecaprenyl pyrophosphate synthase
VAQAVGRVQRAVSLGRLKPEDVTAEDVEQHLYTKV